MIWLEGGRGVGWGKGEGREDSGIGGKLLFTYLTIIILFYFLSSTICFCYLGLDFLFFIFWCLFGRRRIFCICMKQPRGLQVIVGLH